MNKNKQKILNNSLNYSKYLSFQFLLKFILVLFLTIFNFANAQPQQLKANGYASYQELGQEMFLAAIFLETPKNNSQLIFAADEKRRMEIKITASRVSPRRLTRLFLQSAAINNPTALLTAEASSMVAFSSSFTNRLIQGDHIVLSHTPGDGVELLINNIPVRTIASEQFFDVLLRTWIGPIPPTTDFRDNLLGKVNSNLDDKFARLSYQPGRDGAVENWIAGNAGFKPVNLAKRPTIDVSLPIVNQPKIEIETPSIVGLDNNKNTSSNTQETQIPQTDTNKKPEATPENDIQVANTSAQVFPINDSSIKSADANPKTEIINPAKESPITELTQINEPEITNKPLSEEPFNDSKVDPESQKNTTLALNANPKPSIFDDDNEDLSEDLTVESLIAQQLFQSELLKWTIKNLKYPRRALDKGHQGSIRVAVTINREGVLTGTSILEESKYKSLNQAALKAIIQSSPYPRPPETVKGDDFSFLVPINFEIKQR